MKSNFLLLHLLISNSQVSCGVLSLQRRLLQYWGYLLSRNAKLTGFAFEIKPITTDEPILFHFSSFPLITQSFISFSIASWDVKLVSNFFDKVFEVPKLSESQYRPVNIFTVVFEVELKGCFCVYTRFNSALTMCDDEVRITVAFVSRFPNSSQLNRRTSSTFQRFYLGWRLSSF